jgi:signal transduction histidine kinase
LAACKGKPSALRCRLPLDAESLISEVMNYLERIANQRGVRMQAVVEPGLALRRADRGALFTLLKNLLENALQHSHAGGAVQLREIESHLGAGRR